VRIQHSGLSQPAFLILLLVVAVAAGLGGFGFYQLTGPGAAPQAAPAQAQRPGDLRGTTRPEFSLPDLDGELRHISEWDGDVVLVNFWATWCPPCLKEMPAFVEVQEAYRERGVTIVAVAIDSEQDVRDFNETYGLNFPVLLGQSGGMAVSRDYGNRVGALPYSVLFDRVGTIRFVKAGELHKETLEDQLRPLL
jgi:thiol-disulfide isomerase/thioredoxin